MTQTCPIEWLVAESILNRIAYNLWSKIFLCAKATLLWAAVSTLVGAQSANLLSNPSFENDSPDPWQIAHATAATAIVQTDSVDGERSLALSRKGAASQIVRLSAGVYELRAFVRPAAGQTARLRLACKRGLRSEISTDTPDPSSPSPLQTRCSDWRELHAPVFFLPHSASCRVSVKVLGNSAASTLVDSLSLTQHENFLRNPRLLHGQKEWKVVGAPRVPAPPFEFGESENESWLSQTLTLPMGSYTLSASYRSSGGQSLARLEASGCGPQDAIVNLAPTHFGNTYRRVQLRGIQVSNASCTVGVRVRAAPRHSSERHSSERSSSEQWLRVSNLTLEPRRPVLRDDCRWGREPY